MRPLQFHVLFDMWLKRIFGDRCHCFIVSQVDCVATLVHPVLHKSWAVSTAETQISRLFTRKKIFVVLISIGKFYRLLVSKGERGSECEINFHFLFPLLSSIFEPRMFAKRQNGSLWLILEGKTHFWHGTLTAFLLIADSLIHG